MRPTDDMAATIAAYYTALAEALPEALAVEIVFDFAKRLHAGDAPAAPPPSPSDLADAAEAKRARRTAELNSLSA